MSALEVFQYGDHHVRTVVIDGEPWLVLADLCAVLDIANPRNVAARLDQDEKGVRQMDTPGGVQLVTIVKESGMYQVVLRSDKPEAKQFRRWLTHDVLPTIRKTGRYGSDVEMLAALPSAKLLRLAAEAAEWNEQLAAKIEADAPKVHFADTVAASPTTILIGELAKILRAQGVQTGQTRLFETLRAEGYLICREGTDRNMPTQRSMELGLFEITERVGQSPDGEPRIYKTTRVTGKGQQYFIDRYASRDGVLELEVATA